MSGELYTISLNRLLMRQLLYFICLFLIATLPLQSLSAQVIDCKAQDKQVFEKYIKYIASAEAISKVSLLQQTAEFFLGKPYVAGTLDTHKTEKLVVNLSEFDCVTFIETVIALTNTVADKQQTLEDFAAQLQKIRYRNGILTDYASRLHYTSEWTDNNVEKGILKPVTFAENELETKTINFMSTHRSAYAALKTDDSMLAQIKSIESVINERGGFYFLPKNKINRYADKIPHMAVIAFTTSIKGLDTTHTGFAYRKNGKLAFIHASSLKNKVVIDEKSISEYCMSQQSCTGLIVMEVR